MGLVKSRDIRQVNVAGAEVAKGSEGRWVAGERAWEWGGGAVHLRTCKPL